MLEEISYFVLTAFNATVWVLYGTCLYKFMLCNDNEDEGEYLNVNNESTENHFPSIILPRLTGLERKIDELTNKIDKLSIPLNRVMGIISQSSSPQSPSSSQSSPPSPPSESQSSPPSPPSESMTPQSPISHPQSNSLSEKDLVKEKMEIEEFLEEIYEKAIHRNEVKRYCENIIDEVIMNITQKTDSDSELEIDGFQILEIN